MEILNVENVSLNYHSPQGETKALDNISFKVNKGEFIAIVGPSGCGKTTILSLIAGLLPLSSGSIKINVKIKLVTCFRETIFSNGVQSRKTLH